MKKFVFAFDGEQYLGCFRYSKKRKAPHRRWKARLRGMHPDVKFNIDEVFVG